MMPQDLGQICTNETDFSLGALASPPAGRCFFTDGKTSHSNGDTVVCECPVVNGTYQVGENGKACTIPPSGKAQYVWSASDTVVGSCPSN